MAYYIAARPFPTARRQYETGAEIDRTKLTLDEWITGLETGAILVVPFVGTAAELARRTDIPGPGVLVYETDTKVAKFGNGVNTPSGLGQAGSNTYAPIASYPVPGERTPAVASLSQVSDSLPDPGFGPNLVVPPAAVLAASGAAAWYAVNNATLMRFHLSRPRTYRYVNLHVGTASGNIQVGVCRLRPDADSTVLAYRVAHSDVIACPAAGAARIDLGYFTLAPGDYGLFLWCDNTTAQFLHGLSAGVTASRAAFATTQVGGVAAADVYFSTTTRWVTGLSLESAPMPFVAIGDSITANGSPGHNMGWLGVMNAATGYRFAYTNKGNAGETSTQVAARLATDFTALAPRYGSIFVGANDIGQGVAAATTIANLTAMYAAAQAAGIRFLACTVLPRDNTAVGDRLTAQQQSDLRAVNAWIRSNVKNYPLATLCDWAYAMSADGTDETAPKASLFSDHVHPNTAGEDVMAAVYRKAASAWV